MKKKMSEESFLLVSLKEDKAKKLAQVLSNDTSRKILDYLSKKENATETEISKQLDVPLSTIHYNMSHLVKAKLVNDDQFTYSEKGKEVTHYSLSNKYVIIAPRETTGLKDKLKKILPVFAAIAGGTIIIRYFNRILNIINPPMLKSGIEQETFGAAANQAMERAPMIAEQSMQQISAPPASYEAMALWFLIGALFALAVYAGVSYYCKKKKTK
ncbi:helix-turn-helix domain-containing protein [Candidatus Woesearchaeota archaeon]|nr:helix-turn-helix domain-containing protein [Candidatus Woesearchaeota archaeon]